MVSMPSCARVSQHSLPFSDNYYDPPFNRFVVDSRDVSFAVVLHFSYATTPKRVLTSFLHFNNLLDIAVSDMSVCFRDLQKEKFDTVRFELHTLLSNPQLIGVPLLVVRIFFRVSSLQRC